MNGQVLPVTFRSCVATYIDASFTCPFFLPIAIGDRVVRAIDSVDFEVSIFLQLGARFVPGRVALELRGQSLFALAT